MSHYLKSKTYVRYYYLPAREVNGAEIIKVVNSRHCTIAIPMWEEDIVLQPFHTRLMTIKEKQSYKNEIEIWKLFLSWDKLSADHQKYNDNDHELAALENFRDKLLLADDEDI